MSNTNKNNKFNNLKTQKLDWNLIQIEMKNKLGLEVYESWLRKISFIDEFNNYILLSVPTRFIRDWITSRYLDQILQTVKSYKKEIIRIEFKIIEQETKNIDAQATSKVRDTSKNVSFIKDSYLQYNRIDPNRRFDNFITSSSNKLAYEASPKSFRKYFTL